MKAILFKEKKRGDFAIAAYYGYNSVLYSFVCDKDPSYESIIKKVKLGLNNLELICCGREEFDERYHYVHTLHLDFE